MKQSFNSAFCTAIFLSSIAFAQTADPNRFQQFLASDFHKGLVMRALSLIPKDVFQTCPTLKSSGPAVAVTRPVTFGQDGRMTSGAWWERLPVSGCNNDTVLNIFFAVSSDSKINTTTGHPGTTHADLVLQHDAVHYAYQATRTLRAMVCGTNGGTTSTGRPLSKSAASNGGILGFCGSGPGLPRIIKSKTRPRLPM